MIELTREQVSMGEHLKYDPATHDFRWDVDYETCYVCPLEWHDDASYAEYQGDPLADLG